jgi:hypothetical protein
MVTLVCFYIRRGDSEPGAFSQRLQKIDRDTAASSKKETALVGAVTWARYAHDHAPA